MTGALVCFALVVRQVGATEGRRLYGDSYLPLDHFVALHLELAADRIDDHMHDGLGWSSGVVQNGV